MRAILWKHNSYPSIAILMIVPLLLSQPVSFLSAGNDEAAHLPAVFSSTDPGLDQNAVVQFILQLDTPSIAEAMISEQGRPVRLRPLAFSSPRAAEHRLRIQNEQRALGEHLDAMGDVKIQASIDTVLNALVVCAPRRLFTAIENLPNVKRVYLSRHYSLSLDAAAGVQNAQGLWKASGGNAAAGAGIRIGIIDSGIDITNSMFVDETLAPPSGFPKGETNYTNKKVIVARSYAGLFSKQQTINTAIDERGHGSFVAGCAAGKAVAAPLGTISGIAQGAFLGNYKVFGTPGINDTASSGAILAAINDAIRDGMNVLNLSLGSMSHVPASEDPVAKSLSNAIASGVVVVVAAGNSGPESNTVNSPGDTPDAISVGAVSNARAFLPQLRPTGPGAIPSNLTNLTYVPGGGIRIPAKMPAVYAADVATIDANGLACLPLPADSLRGKIAFIAAGACAFSAKISIVSAAGARAAILYNDQAGQNAFEMQDLNGPAIPAVMLSNSDGLALKSYLASYPSATVEIDADSTVVPKTTAPGILAGFSSRGPSAEFALKPDLAAVGENVYSAAQRNDSRGELYNETGFAVGRGTSFAAPMVAGAAAVLMRLHPGFSPQDIKSLLVNTAGDAAAGNGGGFATVVGAGSGLVDMSKAAAAGAAFTPSVLSFGVNRFSPALTLSKPVQIKNVSAVDEEFTLSVSPLVHGPEVLLDRDKTDVLSPGATFVVNVTIRSASSLTGAFQGFINARSTKTSSGYRIPYWSGIYEPDTTRVLTVSQNPGNSNGKFSTLAAALAHSRPGNIIEIADSATYPGGLTLMSNEEGLPLHGITIRAAQGQKPVLSGTGLGAASNINIIGLRNVLIQGITISGGRVGVEITQTSTSIPASVTIDHCTINNISDTANGIGVLALTGGAAYITRSTISRCSREGIYSSGGAQIMLNKSTLDSNGKSGIEAYHSDVQILNSTITGHAGPGAYLESCSGTIDGTQSTNNTGTYGDGFEIVGGLLTITNNRMEANARHGLGLFLPTPGGSGTAGSVTGNTVASNAWDGIMIDSGQNLLLDGNLLKDNGNGIEIAGSSNVLVLNNIVTRSKGFDFPDPLWNWPAHLGRRDATGIYIQGSSNVRIVNDTFYNNRAGCCLPKEIFASGGTTVTVANSIVHGAYPPGSQYKDHILGVPVQNVQYSLVSDPSYATGTNLTGDPRFVASGNDDFSLASDSPAIDAGSTAVENLPFLDYARTLRVASPAFRVGDGKVDMGAIEAYSTYPLVFPVMTQGRQQFPGEDFTTGFAFYSPSGGQVSVTAYGSTGTVIGGTSNPSIKQLQPGAQIPILATQLFGLDPAIPQFGAVLAGSTRRLAGFFLLFDQSFNRFADGVDAGDRTSADLIFMRHAADSSNQTAYAVFNPTTNSATVTAALYGIAGTMIGVPKTGQIPPKGQLAFSFEETTLSSGYVRLRSDRPVSGLELVGNREELSALGAAMRGSDGFLYFPHFALNQGFSTVIGVLNTTGDPVKLTLSAYGNDGSLLGAPVSRSLVANGQLLESVSSMFGLSSGALLTGYVAVRGDRGGLAGFTDFQFDDGRALSAASVPASSLLRPKLLFSHVAHQTSAGSGGTYQTGIALLNPLGVPVQYTMRVFNGPGEKVAEKTETIGAGEKIAKLLSHPAAGAGFFTQSLPLSGGHVEVTSDYGLIGFELFFTEDFSQLASVPAQVIGN